MKQKNYNIPTVVYFVVTALLIAYFFPREGKFRYQFYEGKPWRYGLLTAPSDFPIYKTDDEVKAEKDSVLRKFEPYYRMNPDIQKQEVEKLRANYNNGNNLRSKVSPAYMQYIESSLINLYKNGIISSQDLDEHGKRNIPVSTSWRTPRAASLRERLLHRAHRLRVHYQQLPAAAGQIDPAIV